MCESFGAEPFLTNAFTMALEDAGLDGGDSYLLACPGAAVGSARAAWYPPGEQLAMGEVLASPHARSSPKASVSAPPVATPARPPKRETCTRGTRRTSVWSWVMPGDMLSTSTFSAAA
jgi:hypothetical protein